jgi:tetratricopeptide (TPR) repeat protein
MPAHIFFQLGRWHDAALSDRAAFAASQAWVTRKRLAATMRNYHALSWLQYELLQLGRYREAWATLDEIAPVVKASGQLGLLSDLSTMRARYVIESGAWHLLAGETTFGNANELFAIGASAARTRNATVAERARHGLETRAQDPREGDLRPAIAIMERELAALVALAGGRGSEAVAILETAAASEARLPPPLGLPAPIKPAPELLGEVLVELGRPADAVAFFEQTLRRNPNRSLAVLGLARAAAAQRQTDAARARYRELLANFDGADADLPALAEARAAIAGAPDADDARLKPSRYGFEPSRYVWVIAAVMLLAVIAAAVFVRTRNKAAVSRPARRAAAKRRR